MKRCRHVDLQLSGVVIMNPWRAEDDSRQTQGALRHGASWAWSQKMSLRFTDIMRGNKCLETEGDHLWLPLISYSENTYRVACHLVAGEYICNSLKTLRNDLQIVWEGLADERGAVSGSSLRGEWERTIVTAASTSLGAWPQALSWL